MSDAINALEIELERAWCRLDEKIGSHTLYLTPTGTIWGLDPVFKSFVPKGSIELGSFNRAVSLGYFRQVVFHAYEQQLRGHSNA